MGKTVERPSRNFVARSDSKTADVYLQENIAGQKNKENRGKAQREKGKAQRQKGAQADG